MQERKVRGGQADCNMTFFNEKDIADCILARYYKGNSTYGDGAAMEIVKVRGGKQTTKEVILRTKPMPIA